MANPVLCWVFIGVGVFGQGFALLLARSASGRGVPFPEKSVLPVIYDPPAPHEAQPATFGGMWLFPLATSLFSLPFLLAGWVAMP